MKECAALFSSNTHVPVEGGGDSRPGETVLDRAQGNADIIYGGAEYMLTQFNQEASRASG